MCSNGPGDQIATMVTRIEHGLEVADDDEAPNLATAMTGLCARALEQRQTTKKEPRWVLSDINGEQHCVSEWEKVAVRHNLTGRRVIHQRVPGDLGDTGAATGGIVLAMLDCWWRADCAPAARALVTLTSEAGERGLLAVERGEP